MKRRLAASMVVVLMLGLLCTGVLAQEAIVQHVDASEAAILAAMPEGIHISMSEQEVIGICAQMGCKYEKDGRRLKLLVPTGTYDAEVLLDFSYEGNLQQVCYVVDGYTDNERPFDTDKQYSLFVNALQDAHGSQEIVFDEVTRGELCVSFGKEICWSVQNTGGQVLVTFFWEKLLVQQDIEEMIQEGTILGSLKLGMPTQEAREKIKQMPGWYSKKYSYDMEYTSISLAGHEVAIYVHEDAGILSDITVQFSIWDEAANFSFYNTIVEVLSKKLGPPQKVDAWAGWTSAWFEQDGLYVQAEHDYMIGYVSISISDEME